MPEPVTIANAATSALKYLFTTDDNGQSGMNKLAVGVSIGVFIFLFLYSAIAEFYTLPMSVLTEFFLPADIIEAKHALESDFNRPIIKTGQKGLLALPVTNPKTSSLYGWRYVEIMGGENFHEGIDFPVTFASQVMAVAPGKVVGCGVSRDYGDYIMLEHHMIRYDKDDEIIDEETFYSFYAHLFKRYVFMSQRIVQGQEIALSGGDPTRHFAGNSTGAHLHLELRETQAYATHFDPYDYILKPDPFKGKTKRIGWR